MGSLLGFSSNVITALFICAGMVEVALISIITLLNSGIVCPKNVCKIRLVVHLVWAICYLVFCLEQ